MVEGNKPPTPPENDFMNLGKSWKGGATLVPIECHPEEWKRRGVAYVPSLVTPNAVRGLQYSRRENTPPRTPPKKF